MEEIKDILTNHDSKDRLIFDVTELVTDEEIFREKYKKFLPEQSE